MSWGRPRIQCATLVMLLAVMVLLAAPFNGFGHPFPFAPHETSLSSLDCCGGCVPGTGDDASAPERGCCAAEGCCTACSAPLGTCVLLPAVTSATGRLAGCDPLLLFPEVYLPIFVPPEGRS